MTPTRRAQLLLLAVVALWGATFVIVKDALRDASPFVFNLLRMALATLALALIHHKSLRNLPRATLLKGAAVGVFLAIGYQLQTLGLAHTTAAKSGLLTGLVVIFVPLLTIIPALRPAGTGRPGPFTLLGAALAFAGLILLTTPAGTAFTQIFATISFGDLLTLGCALAFAGHLLCLSFASRTLPPDAGLLATLQIGAATLVMLLTLPLESEHHLTLTPRLMVALLLTSLLATAAAFTIQSYAQQHLPPTQTAIILTLEPVFAWVTSLVILHETMGSRAITGAVLILAGIVVIEFLGHTTQTTEIPA